MSKGSVLVRDSNFGNIATTGGRIVNVTSEQALYVEGNLTINQVPIPRQWLRPAEEDPLRRWEQVVGRSDELDLLCARLSVAGEARATAIWGMPGIGKSALAAVVVHSLGAGYAGGCLWVDLGPTFRKPEQCQRILDHWASYAYGGDVQILQQFTQQMEHWQKLRFDPSAVDTLLTGHGPLLVVLDDIWSLEAIEPLLEALPPEARLLATTRDSRIAEELGPFPLDTLKAADAVDLLRQRLPDLPEETLERLAAGLGYHAQALALAAGDIKRRGSVERRTRAVDEILERVQSGQGLGDLPQLDRRNRQNAVEAAFQASYDDIGQSLGAEYQQRLRFLGGLASPGDSLSTAAAAALWDDEVDAAAEYLDVLRDRGLIRQVGDERWAQHAMVHAYNLALLRREQETDEARWRYVNYGLDLAGQLFEQPETEWVTAPDLPHVYATGNWLVQWATARLGELEALTGIEPAEANPALTEADEPVLKAGLLFAINSLQYVINRPEAGEAGRAWLWLGLAAARLLDAQVQVPVLLTAIGIWYSQRGWYKAAHRYFEAALPLVPQTNSRTLESAVLSNLVQTTRIQGQPERALAYARRVVDMAPDEPAARGWGLNKLAVVYISLGQLPEALAALDEAESLLRDAGDRAGEAVTLQNRAYAYLELGRLDEALQLFEQGLPLLPETSPGDQRATMLQNMGLAYVGLRRIPQAQKLFEQALKLAREAGNRDLEATILHNLGGVYDALGQPEQAYEYIEQALPMLREAGNRAMEGQALLNLGFVRLAGGEVDQALAWAEQALAVFKDIGSLGHAGVAGMLLAEIERRRGHPERATAIADDVLGSPQARRATADKLVQLVRGLTNAPSVMAMLDLAANLYRGVGEHQQAIQLLEQVAALADEVEDWVRLGSASLALVQLYGLTGQADRANLRLRRLLAGTSQAQSLAAQIEAGLAQAEDPASQGPQLAFLGALYLRLGQARTALKYLEQALAAQQQSGQRTSDATLLNVLGMAHQSLRQLGAAAEYYRQAAATAEAAGDVSGQAQSLNNIGLVYQMQGDFEQARAGYEQALQLMRQIGDRVNEGMALSNLGLLQLFAAKPEAAIQVLTEAIPILQETENQVQEAKTLNNISQAYLALDNHAQAETYALSALAVAREAGDRAMEATVLASLGGILAVRPERAAEAVAYFEQALQVLETYQLPQDAAGQTPEQLRGWAAALRQGGALSRVLDSAIEAYFDAPDWSAAREAVNAHSGILLTPVAQEALAAAVGQLAQRGDREESQVVRQHLAVLLASQQVGVDEAFRQAAQQPADAALEAWRARRRLAKGEHARAVDLASRAIALNPEQASYYIVRGRAQQELGNYAAAREDFGQAIRLAPDSGDAFYWRGRAHFNLGDYAPARDDFAAAIERQPDDGFNYGWRGRCHYRLGHFELALADLNQAVRLQPESGNFHFWRGQAALALGETPIAQEALQRATEIDPNLPERHFWHGVALHHAGQAESGDQAWQAAEARVQADTRPSQQHEALAWLSAVRGEDQAAREHYRAALEAGTGKDTLLASLRLLERVLPRQGAVKPVLDWLENFS